MGDRDSKEEARNSVETLQSSRILGWVALVVVVIVSCVASIYVVVPVSEPFGTAFWAVVLVASSEEVWRKDLRPRMLWNPGGLAIIDSRRIHQLSWEEVKVISVAGNKISIRTSNQVIKFRFDRPWLLTKRNTRFRDLPQLVERSLRDCQEISLRGSDATPPNVPSVRRPFLLYGIVGIGLILIVGTRVL